MSRRRWRFRALPARLRPVGRCGLRSSGAGFPEHRCQRVREGQVRDLERARPPGQSLPRCSRCASAATTNSGLPSERRARGARARGRRRRGIVGGQVVGNIRHRERSQRDLASQTMQDEVVRDDVEGRRRRDRADWWRRTISFAGVRRRAKSRTARRSSRDRPVHVLRTSSSGWSWQCLERIADLAQHTLARRPQNLALQRLALLRPDQRPGTAPARSGPASPESRSRTRRPVRGITRRWRRGPGSSPPCGHTLPRIDHAPSNGFRVFALECGDQRVLPMPGSPVMKRICVPAPRAPQAFAQRGEGRRSFQRAPADRVRQARQAAVDFAGPMPQVRSIDTLAARVSRCTRGRLARLRGSGAIS